MFKYFKAIDTLLLPRDLDEQISPYFWLIYLPFFICPVLYFSPNPSDWLLAGISTALFLIVYFHAFWTSRNYIQYHILLIVLIGTLSAFITPSAQTLFIYAAAFCSRLRPVKYSFIALVGIVVWMTLVSVWLDLSAYFYIPGVMFSIVVGLSNIYQHALNEKNKALILSQNEVKRLAQVAERERIARDLHDLIGHSFSMITIKADLAGQMLDHDIEKTRAEIKQLENISREALSQVREVVSGYRSRDLLSEFANAKYLFESVNVSFSYKLVNLVEENMTLDLPNRNELSIIFRELVTNIIKHAKATEASAVVSRINENIVLVVQDNGTGFQASDNSGFGLKGIKERLNKINGNLDIQSSAGGVGTISKISVPFKH